MKATEVLRRLLDERGVEWKAPASYDGSTKYDTIVNGYWFHEYDGRITVHGLTPEKAIAATLGVEPDDAAMVKLHDRMNAALLEYERAQGIEKRDGDSAVVVPFVFEMHSLLEEAATLGSSNCTCNCSNSERTETCHDTGTFKSWGLFTCSNCSIVIPLNAVKDAPSIGRTLSIRYCPNCGRRVVADGRP